MRGRATLMRNWAYAHILLDEPDSDVEGDFTAEPLPAFAGGWRSGVLALVVPERTRNPEAAMVPVDFLTGEKEIRRPAVDFSYPPALAALCESDALNLGSRATRRFARCSRSPVHDPPHRTGRGSPRSYTRPCTRSWPRASAKRPGCAGPKSASTAFSRGDLVLS